MKHLFVFIIAISTSIYLFAQGNAYNGNDYGNTGFNSSNYNTLNWSLGGEISSQNWFSFTLKHAVSLHSDVQLCYFHYPTNTIGNSYYGGKYYYNFNRLYYGTARDPYFYFRPFLFAQAGFVTNASNTNDFNYNATSSTVNSSLGVGLEFVNYEHFSTFIEFGGGFSNNSNYSPSYAGSYGLRYYFNLRAQPRHIRNKIRDENSYEDTDEPEEEDNKIHQRRYSDEN